MQLKILTNLPKDITELPWMPTGSAYLIVRFEFAKTH